MNDPQMMIIELTDEPKARTRRRTFNYVREENFLRHISSYAAEEIRKGDEKAFRIIYRIPLERIEGKWIYELGFTNSGNFVAFKFKANDLLLGRSIYELPSHKVVDEVELKGLEIEVRSENVERLMNDVLRTYDPMIKEVKNYIAGFEKSIITSGRLSDWLHDIHVGLMTNLCLWPEQSRVSSIKSTSKLAYQLWIFKLTHEALRCKKLEKNWFLELGSSYPASIFIDGKNKFWTGWWEPQKVEEAPPDYKGPLCEFFEGRVAWKRPDMLFAYGRYGSLVDVKSFDVLIECKNFRFEEWWIDGVVLDNELRPYVQLFKPKLFVLASLHPVPGWARRLLENEGISVIDRLHPSSDTVKNFTNLLRDKFDP